MMDSAQLKIRLLGPVQLLFKGQPLQIRRRMERAVLYILAAENKPLSRAQLIDRFWPDGEVANPRSALRTTLSRLRNELPDPDLLITDLDQIRLDSRKYQTDLVLFEEDYLHLKNSLSAYREDHPLPAQVVRQIENALALWAGENIIEGDDLSVYSAVESWRQTLNRNLRQHRKFLMKKLAHHHETAGRPDLALDILLKISRSDALEVQTHVDILNLMISLGRHQEAASYCDDLEILFEKDFNAPLPDAILERCRNSQMQLNQKKTSQSDWPYPLSMQLQFVGRQEQLTQLQQCFFQGGLILLEGVMGSGKTRLVQELYRTLSPRPHLFLAPSHEMEHNLPLAPIIHGLRKCIPGDIWTQIDEIWARQISLLIPELSDIRPDLDQLNISNMSSGQQHLFDALLHLLNTTVRTHGRMLFFLDDAQWTDQYTIQAISYLLAQGFFDQHGVLVLAARPEEPNQVLDQMIEEFHRSQTVRKITLNGLDRDALRELVRQIFDEAPQEKFIRRLFNETKGNPFIAIEIVRAILETPGDLAGLGAILDLPLPNNVRSLIRKRLNLLDNNARQILECAAVLGSSFSTDLLLAVSGRDSENQTAAIDLLVRSGFLQIISGDPLTGTALQFVHDKMREVTLLETSVIHLQMLHRKVAHQLSKRPDSPAKAAVIANHYLSGADVRNAFKWFLKAAKYTWSIGSTEDATQNYEQAENLVINAPANFFSLHEIINLYQAWNDFAYQSNQIATLETNGIKLQYFGERDSSPMLIGLSQIALANAAFLRNEFDTGSDLIDKALLNIRKGNHPKMLAEALIRKGALSWWMVKLDESLTAFNQALEIIQTAGPTPDLRSLEFTARYMAGTTYYAQGNGLLTLSSAHELMDRFFHLLAPFDRIRALLLLSYGTLIRGDFGACLEAASNALEIAGGLENPFIEEMLLLTRSKAELALGYLDESYQHAQKALRLGEASRHQNVSVAANSILGDIHFRIEQFTKANHYFRYAKYREGVKNVSHHGLENDIHLAYFLAQSGQIREAKTVLEKPLEFAKQCGMEQLHAQALLISSVCDQNEPDGAVAKKKFQQAEAIFQKNGLDVDLLWLKAARSRSLILHHKFDQSRVILSDLLTDKQSPQSVWITLEALDLSAQLDKATEDCTQQTERQTLFEALVTTLTQHVRSEPLRLAVKSAISSWKKRGYSP